MINSVTGIILAGGRSSRMGEDKSLMKFSGKPLIENMIDKLRPLFGELIIVTNQPHLYEKYGIKTKQDILPGRGSLGGIYTGLLSSNNEYNFIAACDMPLLNQQLVRHLVNERYGYDAVVPEYNGRFQPLCSVYSKNCIQAIEAELSKDNLRITDFFSNARVKVIVEEEVEIFDSGGSTFININTRDDYKCALQSPSAE